MWVILLPEDLLVPYTTDYIGVYKIVNNVTGGCYVGQSQRVKKRVGEHFRQLRRGIHPNPRLQHTYNKYGRTAFTWALEVECADVKDLDTVENAFLVGDAYFDEPVVYNIADFAKAPMRGKSHSPEVRRRIAEGRRAAAFNYRSNKYRQTQSKILTEYHLARPEYVKKVKFIVDNPDMTYAERGRIVGSDTSSTRKMALKYKHLRGVL
jgi:group I intron endonuclease